MNWSGAFFMIPENIDFAEGRTSERRTEAPEWLPKLFLGVGLLFLLVGARELFVQLYRSGTGGASNSFPATIWFLGVSVFCSFAGYHAFLNYKLRKAGRLYPGQIDSVCEVQAKGGVQISVSYRFTMEDGRVVTGSASCPRNQEAGRYPSQGMQVAVFAASRHWHTLL